jgi:hypothetical protein
MVNLLGNMAVKEIFEHAVTAAQVIALDRTDKAIDRCLKRPLQSKTDTSALLALVVTAHVSTLRLINTDDSTSPGDTGAVQEPSP